MGRKSVLNFFQPRLQNDSQLLMGAEGVSKSLCSEVSRNTARPEQTSTISFHGFLSYARDPKLYFFPSSLCKLSDKESSDLKFFFVKEEAKEGCWLVLLQLPWCLLAHTERGDGASRLAGHRWATPWKNRAGFWLSGIKEGDGCFGTSTCSFLCEELSSACKQ